MSFNTFKPRRIKIVEPNWDGYTGWFGQVEFKDGVSIEVVSHVDQMRLGAILRIESAEDSEEGTQINQGADLLRIRKTEAAAAEVTKVGTGVNTGEETISAVELPIYTREQLEDIADKRGINGLRDIAKVYNVVGSSINTLIDKILKAQAPVESEQPSE